jgi:hypothetical protein
MSASMLAWSASRLPMMVHTRYCIDGNIGALSPLSSGMRATHQCVNEHRHRRQACVLMDRR